MGRTDLVKVEEQSPTQVRTSIVGGKPKNHGTLLVVALPESAFLTATGDVATPQPPESPQFPGQPSGVPFQESQGSALVGLAWLPLVAIIPALIWRSQRRSVIPPVTLRYDVPDDLDPMTSGLLLNGRTSPQDVIAGVIALAQKGAVRIIRTENSDTWAVELRPLSEAQGLTNADQFLFAQLEPYGPFISSDVLQAHLRNQHGQISNSIRSSAVNNGYFVAPGSGNGSKGCLPAVGVLIVSGLLATILTPLALLFGVIAAVIVLGAMSSTQSLTDRGLATRNHLIGLRQFIWQSNNSGFGFYDRTRNDPALYGKLLPYAIAFGIGRQWTQAYDGIDLDEPYWYSGPTAGDIFWATALMDDFSNYGYQDPQAGYYPQQQDTPAWANQTDQNDSPNWNSGDSGFGNVFGSSNDNSNGGSSWGDTSSSIDTSSSFDNSSSGFDSSSGSFDSGGSVDSGGGGGGGDSW